MNLYTLHKPYTKWLLFQCLFLTLKVLLVQYFCLTLNIKKLLIWLLLKKSYYFAMPKKQRKSQILFKWGVFQGWKEQSWVIKLAPFLVDRGLKEHK